MVLVGTWAPTSNFSAAYQMFLESGQGQVGPLPSNGSG